MTTPISLVLVVIGLVVSARIRLSAVIFGQPVSVSVLELVIAVLVLALTAMVLWLARLVIQDGLRSRPRWAER